MLPLGGRCSRHNGLICFATVFICNFIVLSSSSEDAASLETTSQSCRERIPTSMLRSHGWVCVSISVEAGNVQLRASRSLEVTSTLETVQLLQRVGVLKKRDFLVLLARPKVLRDGSIDHCKQSASAPCTVSECTQICADVSEQSGGTRAQIKICHLRAPTH